MREGIKRGTGNKVVGVIQREERGRFRESKWEGDWRRERERGGGLRERVVKFWDSQLLIWVPKKVVKILHFLAIKNACRKLSPNIANQWIIDQVFLDLRVGQCLCGVCFDGYRSERRN